MKFEFKDVLFGGLFALIVGALVLFIASITGCNSTASNARDAIAGFHGYLVSAQEKHTLECIQNNGHLAVCDTLRRADAAQNAALYAVASYCQIPLPTAADVQGCKPVKDLEGGLQAALSNLNALTAELKKAAQ